MSPERQKRFVYYRCQNSDCPTTTVREDIVDHAIRSCLKDNQLSHDDQAKLTSDWEAWLAKENRTPTHKSLDLQVGQVQARIERLTDLLIDGTLNKDQFNARKQDLLLELQEKQAMLDTARTKHLDACEMQKFLELMKNLTGLYECGNPAEKRWMVQEWFSNRTVDGKQLCLEPSSWLKSRNPSDLAPYVKKHDPLLELLSRISKR